MKIVRVWSGAALSALWSVVTRAGRTPGTRGAMVLRSAAALVAAASVGAALVALGALHHL